MIIQSEFCYTQYFDIKLINTIITFITVQMFLWIFKYKEIITL